MRWLHKGCLQQPLRGLPTSVQLQTLSGNMEPLVRSVAQEKESGREKKVRKTPLFLEAQDVGEGSGEPFQNKHQLHLRKTGE